MFDPTLFDPTNREAYTAVRPTRIPQKRFFRGKLSQDDLLRHIDTLSAVVRELLVEVEALRVNAEASPSYKSAYWDTCLDAHNNCGPSDGWMKLLAKFFPGVRDDKNRVWREAVMLRRLGFDESDIETFRNRAEIMEAYT